MLTFISPCVAPIAGAYISEGTTWRWIFWSTSIFDLVVQAAALFFLSETYAPRILDRRAARMRRETGNPNVRTEYDEPLDLNGGGNGKGRRAFGPILRRRLVLPFVMMFTHPAVQAPSLYRAYLYGVQYLVLATFSWVWTDRYGMDLGTSSLHYLALCAGFMVGLQISRPLMDGVSSCPMASYPYYLHPLPPE